MMFQERKKTHHMGSRMRQFVEAPVSLPKALDAPGEKEQVIYIHVPYCSNICSFCNMNRTLNKPKDDYIDLVIEQLKYYAGTRRFRESTFASVYFGGGTPTVLSAKDLTRFLDALHRYANLEPDVEISMETSLTDLDMDKFKQVVAAGVNRFSIGIQTFSDRGRKLLGRRGDKAYALRRLHEMRATGFEGLNVDLIYNWFKETDEDLLEDINMIRRTDVAGFSLYSLIIMDASKLGRRLESHEVDTSLARDRHFFDLLDANTRDYEYLELTKKIMPGRDRYRYIRQRIKGKDTFPLGAGAGGGIGRMALMNPIKIDDFRHHVAHPEAVRGMAFTDAYYKIKRGLDTLQTLYYDPASLADERLNRWFDQCIEAGWMYRQDGTYRLTKDGIFWGNNIIDEAWNVFLDEAQA
ncbi:MAG: radical SAM protein [Eubacteriales bacterium]|nr:radical SAM protein [Eubacteriales bacterium]